MFNGRVENQERNEHVNIQALTSTVGEDGVWSQVLNRVCGPGRRAALFLDRDGVLVDEVHYLCRPEDARLSIAAVDVIGRANGLSVPVVIVTNQAGIARGYYDAADLDRLHRWMNADLRKIGAHIDRFYHCPHHPDISGECDCRKPNPGMLKQAMRDWPIDLPRSFMIGDKSTDMEAAKRSNVTGHLFSSGNLHATVNRILGTPPV